MSTAYKPLTKDEKESSIRQGIIPASGQRDTILSVIQNVLETGFDWRVAGPTLHITHPSGSIEITGNQCDFQWTK